MKFACKLLALILSLSLIFSLAACGGDDNETSSDNGTNSKPTNSAPSNSNGTESKHEKPDNNTASGDNKNEIGNDKNEDEKNENKTENDKTPEPPVEPDEDKVIPNSAIIGRWNSVDDACEILAEYGLELNGPININIITTFGDDNSYGVELAENTYDVLRSKIPSDYDDAFVEQCMDYLVGALVEAGEYKFENDTLMMRVGTDDDFTDFVHKFQNSEDKLVISDYSSERSYTRIK